MIWGRFKMLDTTEKKYLEHLIKQAKEKVKEKYDVEIKGKIVIDEKKSLQENN